MLERSERLLTLLGGEPAGPPPLWEPWFAMGDFLRRRYGGSYIDMALDLGHAAVPLQGLDLRETFIAEAEVTPAGAYYAGGALRSVEQLHEREEPDYEAMVEPLCRQREAIHRAGLACWVVLGWCFDRMAASMGLEHLAMACYDEPEFVARAMQWVEARNQQAVERVLARVRPDFVLYNGDCAYKTAPMIHPAMIRGFCLEASRQTVQAVAALDIPFAFHTDGRLDEVLPIILDLGCSAVHGCEKQANDLSHLVDTFGQRITLCGNMDVVFMAHATPPLIRAETFAMLDTGSRHHRFIAATNTSPQDYIPDANYLAFCRAVADYHGR